MRRIIKRWDWSLVAALAPLLLFPQGLPIWVLSFYPPILCLQWWAWGEVLPLTPLNPAVLLIAIMSGVSIFVTPDLQSSLVKLTGLLLGMLVFFTVARHSRTRQGWKACLGLFFLAGIGVAGVGLVGMAWLPSRYPEIDELLSALPFHLTGLPGAEAGINANEVAGALLWVLPLLGFAFIALLAEPKWFSSQNRRKFIQLGESSLWVIIIFLAVLICAAVFLLSQSRDGYLAMAVACPILLVLLLRSWPRYILLGLLVLGVVVGVVVLQHAGAEQVFNRFFASLPAKGTQFSINSLFGRAEIWHRAVWAIQDAPLTGLGMNIFRQAVYLQSPPFADTGFDIAHAHDEVLQSALDLGLPGTLAFLALYLGAVGMLIQAARGRGAWRMLALGLIGGLLAHFLFGLTDAVALGAKPGFLLWWMLGMAYGLYEQYKAQRVVAR